MRLACLAGLVLWALWTCAASAQNLPAAFKAGPLIDAYGPAADVPGAPPLPDELALKVRFDIADGGEPGAVNRRFVTAARFLNMHARAGMPADAMAVALVVHGGATVELTEAAYAERKDAENANIDLLRTLMRHGVRVIVCGQSAAANGLTAGDFLDGVEMSLSAMTAHALLRRQDYGLNPF